MANAMWLLCFICTDTRYARWCCVLMSDTRLMVWDTYREMLRTHLPYINITEVDKVIDSYMQRIFSEHFTRLGAIHRCTHYPLGALHYTRIRGSTLGQKAVMYLPVYSISLKLIIGSDGIRIWEYQVVLVMYLRRLWGCYSFTWIYLELMNADMTLDRSVRWILIGMTILIL